MKTKDWTVGESALSVRFRTSREGEVPTMNTCVITKVGRKYVYARTADYVNADSEKYDKATGREVSEYSSDTTLYKSIKHYEDCVEAAKVYDRIRNAHFRTSKPKASLDQLRRIEKILTDK